MRIINSSVCFQTPTLMIGRRGENAVTEVRFDYSAWEDLFGTGVIDLYVKRNGDAAAYPVVLNTETPGIAVWTITNTDTNVIGKGKAELTYTINEQLAKSYVMSFEVTEDIGQPASDPPDPYVSWLETLGELGAITEANAQAAERAQEAAETAQEKAETAQGKAEDAQTAAETAQGKAEDAQTAAETAQGKAEDAQTAAETAQGKAEDAEDAAVEAKNDAETAQGYAESARDAAAGSASAAGTAALKAEGFAVGEQNGAAVPSGSPYYHNNSKYYADAAQQAANTAGYIDMEIDENGHLIYTKTSAVDVDFELDENGHLIMEVV